MRILLKAMGFWIWGLIAIGLSLSLVTLSYRLANYRWPADPVVLAPSPTTDVKAAAESPAVPAPNIPSPKGAMISRVIAKQMTAAQIELQGQRWNEALDNLEAALTKSPLTGFDVKTIYDFEGFANVKLSKYKAAQKAYEAELATGIPTAQELVQLFRILFKLTANTGQYSKAIEYGQQLADSEVVGAEDLALMSQLFYLNKDCKGSSIWGDKAIAAFRGAGEQPNENVYQFKLQCASDAGDTAGMAAVAADLIRLTNKPNYWNTLLRIERQDERDDRNLLMIYRLMYDTHSMSVGTDYIEMAQLLGDVGLPGEALTVLERAVASGLVLDNQKERTTRLMEAMRTRTDADRRALQGDANSSEGLSAPRNENLGEVYFGFGEYQAAVASIAAAVEKHAVKRLDDAYVYLGRSEVALKDAAAARTAFMQLKTVPNVSPRVMKIWSLYAETIGH
jgi:tetratricopeptide (TPR) repeat protein